MKLEYLLNSTHSPEQWAQAYAELELYFNPGSPSGWSSHRVGISRRYNPESYKQNTNPNRQLRAVKFPFYLVDRADVQVMQANPSPEVLEFLGLTGKDVSRLAVVAHPDALKILPIQRKKDGDVEAYLTASTRTILTNDNNPVFLKLDYPEMIGRCPRRLGISELHQGTFFSKRLDAWSQANLLSPTCGYLPETLGVLWQSDAVNADIGMICRETRPRPSLDSRSIYIPFFALSTQDYSSEQDPTLLTQIIRTHATGNVSPHDLLLHITGLVFEALRCLFEPQRNFNDNQVDKFRLLHDCHGQNLLLELDPTGFPRRALFRDFQHMYPVVLDAADRIDYLAEQNRFCKVLDMRLDPEYVTRKISQLIDFKLGRYVIARLAADFEANFASDREEIMTSVRSQFQEKLGVIDEILPKGVWYRRSDGTEWDEYGRVRLVQGEGVPFLRE